MKISVNSAGKTDLLLLPGINLSDAEAILRERDRKSGFASQEEFMDYVARLDVQPHFYKKIEEVVDVIPITSGSARVIDF